MPSAIFKASAILSTRLPFLRPSTTFSLNRAVSLAYRAGIQPHRSPAQLNRTFTQRAWLAYPRKDSQDKDSINREPTEYSKSGTDDEAAGQEDAAFDPNKTDPQEEMETAGEGIDGNPLDVSPANPDVSKPRGGTEGGAENSSSSSGSESDRKRTSGRGSPNKGSKVS